MARRGHAHRPLIFRLSLWHRGGWLAGVRLAGDDAPGVSIGLPAGIVAGGVSNLRL